MLEKGDYDPEQHSNAEVLLFLHKFWLAFAPQAIVLIVAIILPFLVFTVLVNMYGWQAFIDRTITTNIGPMFAYMIGIFAYLLILVNVFFNAWVTFYFDVVIVTRTHLITVNQYGFFNRKVAEQSLLRVQDVSARTTGFFQTWLRYGTVFVETAGEAPNFIMPDLRNSHMVANTILKLHDELVSTEYEEMAIEGEGDLRPPEPHYMNSDNQPVFNPPTKPNNNDFSNKINNQTQDSTEISPKKDNLQSLKTHTQEIEINEIGSFEEFNKTNAVEAEKREAPLIQNQQSAHQETQQEEGNLKDGESIKL